MPDGGIIAVMSRHAESILSLASVLAVVVIVLLAKYRWHLI